MNKLSENLHEDRDVYFIAKIFENNPNKFLASREINSMYTLMSVYNKVIENNLSSDLRELTKLDTMQVSYLIPGDVQRALRKFTDIYLESGMIKEYHWKDLKDNELYKNEFYENLTDIEKKNLGWKSNTPFYKYDPEIIYINPDYEPRKFKSDTIENVTQKNDRKCECCKILTNDNIAEENPCGDHWRSWDRYRNIRNITTEGNCVLLCQKCNNIKSNRSGIHLVRKERCTLEVWQEIEDRITENGFPPNDEETSEIEEIRNQLDIC